MSSLAQIYAAESIQMIFRNYKYCKVFKLHLEILKIAKDTIEGALLEYVHHFRRTRAAQSVASAQESLVNKEYNLEDFSSLRDDLSGYSEEFDAETSSLNQEPTAVVISSRLETIPASFTAVPSVPAQKETPPVYSEEVEESSVPLPRISHSSASSSRRSSNSSSLTFTTLLRSMSASSNARINNRNQLSSSRGSSREGLKVSKPASTVFDLAFSTVTESMTNLSLYEYEMRKLITSLGYESVLPYNAGLTSLDRGKLMNLPFKSPQAMASMVTQYVRSLTDDGDRCKAPFTLSEKKSLLAIKHLTSLVKGNLRRVRRAVLANSSLYRPSEWTRDQITLFLSALELPLNKFNIVNGSELLELPSKTVDESLHLPSLLQLRFHLHQRTLLLLEKWWDNGQRPSDESTEPSTNFMKISSHKYAFQEGDRVYVNDSAGLLAEWIPLNRGFGWGASLEYLTGLADLVTGRIVTVENDSLVFTGCKLVSFDKPLEADEASILPVYKTKMLFVPMRLLQKAATNEVLVGLSLEQATMHTLVKISSMEALVRAYEGQEWWERPPVKILKQVAERTGEIVSIAELTRKGRVGVHVQSCGIIDAFPITCLSLPSINEPTVNAEPNGKSLSALSLNRTKESTNIAFLVAKKEIGDDISNPVASTQLSDDISTDYSDDEAELSSEAKIQRASFKGRKQLSKTAECFPVTTEKTKSRSFTATSSYSLRNMNYSWLNPKRRSDTNGDSGATGSSAGLIQCRVTKNPEQRSSLSLAVIMPELDAPPPSTPSACKQRRR